ncbi:MAG: amidase [Alphaproteobacteria bacterium]|nr:amidase [Alphaproteobacteria bacterium]
MSEIPTIAEAAKLIAAKKLSPVELTKSRLARVKALDGQLNAFLLVTEERALADARAAEARMLAGTLKGPLDGIPIAHKDIYNTAGIRTTAHSRFLKDNVPAEDAHTVKRWADAGTVLLGKLATHEFAFGGPSFDLPWPPSRNPWNIEHFTAGSSSGTGAAVAAGLILGGTGSDTGGSIRGPAAFCGIAGIKPTYGLSSRAGILPLAFSLDTAGPMAWTAEDCALLLQAMAGHDARDPASARRPIPDFTGDLGKGAKGLRIGVVRHFFEQDHPVSAATLKGIDAALDFFRQEGATVRDIQLSPAADYHACGFLIMIGEAFALHLPWLQERFGDYAEMFRHRVAPAALMSGPDMSQAQRRRRVLAAEMRAAMAGLDIIVSASAPGEAPKIADLPKWTSMEKPSFTMPFNVTGFPAISVCTGFGASGLPVAIQLAALPFQEPTLFRAAHAYERATEWRARRPALAAA